MYRATLLTSLAIAVIPACGQHRVAGEPARTTSSEPIPSGPPLHVTEDIARRCKLANSPADAPDFDFDSAQLEDRAARIVSDVATCLTVGPMSDAEITLTGHSDARGPSRYNQQLGLYRAEAVRLALIDLGVPSERIHVASRGEKDATASSPRARQFDRRVEISIRRVARPR